MAVEMGVGSGSGEGDGQQRGGREEKRFHGSQYRFGRTAESSKKGL
jgi:hypothetical protein